MPLLETDMDYQTYTRASGKAEQAYMDLDLTKEQREIVSALLDCRDNAYSEYSVLAYLAGLADGARIFAMLDILHRSLHMCCADTKGNSLFVPFRHPQEQRF